MTTSPASSEHCVRPRPRAIDELIRSLRHSIVTGELARGARIPTERQLAERFGLSQPTVREALRVLETIGLIEVRHGRGIFVAADSSFILLSTIKALIQFEDVGLLELLDVREILGRESAFLAARNATEGDIIELRLALADLSDTDALRDVSHLVAKILRYQRALSSAAHVPLLSKTEDFLAAILLAVQMRLACRTLDEWKSRAVATQASREQIIECIVRHDPTAAHAAMETLLGKQRALLEEDDVLRTLRLSDPKVAEAISGLVDGFRAR